MLLHQHLKTTERHAKHFSELHGVHSELLSVEHSWLLVLYFFQVFQPVTFFCTDALNLDLTLDFLVSDISFRELLPLVVDLLVDHTVGLLEDLSYVVIDFELHVHLHADELLHDLDLRLQSIDLGTVRVFEVVGDKIHAGALRHQVDYDLN